MTYEQKRKKVGIAVAEAFKFSSKDNPPEIHARKNEYVNNIPLNEIKAILNQFQDEEKLKIINITYSSLIPTFDPETYDLFIFEVKDREFFNEMMPPKELDIEESPMRKMRKTIEYVTGITDEERNKMKINEDSKADVVKSRGIISNEYFIEYRDDRTILLNGKIDIGRPRFNTQSEILFSFLYKHPNETFTLAQLEKETKLEIVDKLPKVIDRIGFRRGLKKAFFDIHENTINYKKTTVRFRSKITL